jgi:hypothetical protein
MKSHISVTKHVPGGKAIQKGTELIRPNIRHLSCIGSGVNNFILLL